MSTLQRLAYEPMPTARLGAYVLGIVFGGLIAAALLYLVNSGSLPLLG